MKRIPNQKRLVITQQVPAVRVAANNALTGPIREIPRAAEVQIAGMALRPEMVTVIWDGACYAVFESDLAQRTVATADDA